MMTTGITVPTAAATATDDAWANTREKTILNNTHRYANPKLSYYSRER